MTDTEIREVVARHRTVPVKLGALAKDLGLEVFKSTLKPDISGLIEPSKTAPSGFRVRINRHDVTERQRFTLAHEIAHFILHRSDIGGGLVDDVLYRSSLSTTKEVQANKLAAKLVMPDELVQAENRKLGVLPFEDRVARLAELFRVSPSAMRIKLGA